MIPRERIIYDNYDLSEKYPDDELKAIAVECEWIGEDEVDDISDEQLWAWRYREDEVDWDNEKYELTKFFEGKTVGFFGSVGRWDGVYKAGKIGEFWDLFYKAIEDCAYIKLYDENGHMYLTCSHHDGTCHFEIKEITDEGREYFDRWEYSWGDKRSEQYVHGQIHKRYSRLPNYMHKVCGCPKRDYEPQSKAGFIRQLNNQAKSFYAAS